MIFNTTMKEIQGRKNAKGLPHIPESHNDALLSYKKKLQQNHSKMYETCEKITQTISDTLNVFPEETFFAVDLDQLGTDKTWNDEFLNNTFTTFLSHLYYHLLLFFYVQGTIELDPHLHRGRITFPSRDNAKIACTRSHRKIYINI